MESNRNRGSINAIRIVVAKIQEGGSDNITPREVIHDTYMAAINKEAKNLHLGETRVDLEGHRIVPAARKTVARPQVPEDLPDDSQSLTGLEELVAQYQAAQRMGAVIGPLSPQAPTDLIDKSSTPTPDSLSSLFSGNRASALASKYYNQAGQ
jgi:hypothetical protein